MFPFAQTSATDLGVVDLPDGRAVPCLYARSFWARLKGLLDSGRDRLGGGVICLDPCTSIHTFGMAYPIDVAFLDECGIVVASRRRLAPCRVLRSPQAACVLERPSDGSPWLAVGETVRLRI